MKSSGKRTRNAGPSKAAAKKYFTPAEANATLPLVRAIVGDIIELARHLRGRHEQFVRLSARSENPQAHRDELEALETELEAGEERMHEYQAELGKIGVELKDYLTGLIDFRCMMDGREVYLCWRAGEPEVAHWHELDAGVAGRQKLMTPASH